MSLITFPQLTGLARTLHEMRNALDRAYTDEWTTSTTTSAWAPRVNIRETQEEIELSADLPGIRKDDLSLELENNLLVIRGTRRNDTEDATGTFHRVEKVYGSFERTFSLPGGLDKEQVSATLKDGVLVIHIPKADEAKPRQVEIRIQD